MSAESEHAESEPRGERGTVEAQGDSIGDAKWEVLKDLEPRFPGITADCIRFEVLDEGSPGRARVKGVVDEQAWENAADADLPEDPAERLRSVVTRVVQELGLRGTVDVVESDEELRATVDGEDLGLLIGKHGQTIDALQQLALRIAFGGLEDRKRVVVDAAGYRAKREVALQRAAEQAVSDALREGRPVALEAMRAAERKIVHMYLRDRTDIGTHSEGDEPDRRLVVTPRAPLDS